MYEIPEILLIDKPSGITSFDVIRRLRQRLGVRKMGHAGTLDPMATGLMILGVGTGTKRLTDYIKLDKEYVAEVRLGERTTTGDIDGEVVEEKEVTAAAISRSDIAAAVESLIGTQTLPVSAYSAIKQGGVPFYKKARAAAQRGQTLSDAELPQREMEVYEAELLDFTVGGGRAVATIRFLVASGTYVRSLGEALGRRLGYPATLQALRRTKVGDFDIKDAQYIEDF